MSSNKKGEVIIHLNVVVYGFSYYSIIPLTPFILDSYTDDPATFYYFNALISTFQLLGVFVVGWLLDTKGAKIAILISQTCASICCLSMGLSPSLPFMFLGQVAQLLRHTYHCSQTYISYISEEENRAKCLGRLAITLGIGIMLGTVVGGSIGNRLGPFIMVNIAGILLLLTVFITSLLLPEMKILDSNEYDNDDDNDVLSNCSILNEDETKTDNSFISTLVYQVVLIQCMMGLALQVQTVSFPQVLQHSFNFNSEDIGYTIALGGSVSLLSNSAVAWGLTRFSERKMVVLAQIVMCISYLIYSQCQTYLSVLLILLPMSASSSMAVTFLSSLMTKLAKKNKTGSSLGYLHSSRATCGVLASPISAYTVKNFGFNSLGYVSFSLMIASILYSTKVLFPSKLKNE